MVNRPAVIPLFVLLCLLAVIMCANQSGGNLGNSNSKVYSPVAHKEAKSDNSETVTKKPAGFHKPRALWPGKIETVQNRQRKTLQLGLQRFPRCVRNREIAIPKNTAS